MLFVSGLFLVWALFCEWALYRKTMVHIPWQLIILFLLSHVLSMDALTHLHAEALMGVLGTHCSKGWFSFEESCVLTVPRGG